MNSLYTYEHAHGSGGVRGVTCCWSKEEIVQLYKYIDRAGCSAISEILQSVSGGLAGPPKDETHQWLVWPCQVAQTHTVFPAESPQLSS